MRGFSLGYILFAFLMLLPVITSATPNIIADNKVSKTVLKNNQNNDTSERYYFSPECCPSYHDIISGIHKDKTGNYVIETTRHYCNGHAQVKLKYTVLLVSPTDVLGSTPTATQIKGFLHKLNKQSVKKVLAYTRQRLPYAECLYLNDNDNWKLGLNILKSKLPNMRFSAVPVGRNKPFSYLDCPSPNLVKKVFCHEKKQTITNTSYTGDSYSFSLKNVAGNPRPLTYSELNKFCKLNFFDQEVTLSHDHSLIFCTYFPSPFGWQNGLVSQAQNVQ